MRFDVVSGGAATADVDTLWTQLAGAADAATFCRAWLGLQCADIEGTHRGLLLLEDEARTFVPAAVWPGANADVSALVPVARRCLAERAGCVERVGEGPVRFAVGYPLELGGQVLGAVVLDLGSRSESKLREAQRRLHWGAGRLELLLQARRNQAQEQALDRARLALDCAIGVGDQARLDAAALVCANLLAERLGCERVAVGIERGGRIHLQAMSGSAWFDRKSDQVGVIENAMEEAAEQGCTVAHPIADGTKGIISIAHRDLAGRGAACTVPLRVQGRAIGAITVMQHEPVAERTRAAVEAVAALLAPEFELRRDLDRWVAGRLRHHAREFWGGLKDPRRPTFRVAAAGIAALLLLLAVVPGEYRVTGKAVVEGEVQRAIVAPFDGFVATSRLRAGQTVRAGDVLATLDDRDLALERQKWLAEAEQADRRYRDALAKHDRANARILAAQYEEASAQWALAEEKLTRAKLAAPFDGVIVSGDLSQMLGSPVEKGKVLFEVAPLDAYRVIVKVPEADTRDLRVGQPGRIVLAAMSGSAVPFKVRNIGTAVAEDGKNLFRIEADLQQVPPGIRPGMEGVGKVVVGERRLLWIWTHRFFDWMGLKLWQWLP
jgi:RND family efflux transporter MFP subunit